MAGIGEASAIIAVAGLGFKLSKRLVQFATDTKDAGKAISRFERDIRTTSETLEDVGKLIGDNNTAHLFNKNGITRAVRCSEVCKAIIADIETVLSKIGLVTDPAAFDKKDQDISFLQSLRWPFVKNQLRDLQIELEKTKLSLTLVFVAVMAAKCVSL